MFRITRLVVLSLLALVLAACAAPATTPPSTGSVTGSTAAAPPATPRVTPPMSSPLPARQVRPMVSVDTACKTSADCAVKNVGNCCGAMPACVNKDSPTDPGAVQAECSAKGMMGVCGFKEISACQCDNGQCAPADNTVLKAQ